MQPLFIENGGWWAGKQSLLYQMKIALSTLICPLYIQLGWLLLCLASEETGAECIPDLQASLDFSSEIIYEFHRETVSYHRKEVWHAMEYILSKTETVFFLRVSLIRTGFSKGNIKQSEEIEKGHEIILSFSILFLFILCP